MTALLETRDLAMRFGGLTAVEKFCCSIEKGELFGLIGPNGAGKTTVFNMLTGVYKPSEGEIVLDGTPTTGLAPADISARGVSRTFQNIRLFDELSVLENVMAGAHQHAKINLLDALLRTGRYRREEESQREQAMRLLDFVGLGDRAGLPARALAYGHRRKLEIARALATQPRLLCLDEPGAGMNHAEKLELSALIRRIRDELGITILLIEHDMKLVMGLCERIQVLDHGQTICCGAPAEVQCNDAVIEAYLGAGESGRKKTADH
ncbi:MAG: ABC transporter ATP-binding protein [Planctomycetes bacterium]|nr:ABC transporter ATP-binding protein [Planctomycetota bacterium]